MLNRSARAHALVSCCSWTVCARATFLRFGPGCCQLWPTLRSWHAKGAACPTLWTGATTPRHRIVLGTPPTWLSSVYHTRPPFAPHTQIARADTRVNLCTRCRYEVKPCLGTVNASRRADNIAARERGERGYLRSALLEQLSPSQGGESACFEFRVQPQLDPCRDALEDPTQTWSGPWTHVATLRIPAQVPNTQGMEELCQDLAYNPWHSLEDHRPLGGINRQRLLGITWGELAVHAPPSAILTHIPLLLPPRSLQIWRPCAHRGCQGAHRARKAEPQPLRGL